MASQKQLITGGDDDLHGLSLTSADILQQKFAVRFRGYDVHDVDSFLEVVAREIDRLMHEAILRQEELTAVKREVETFRKKEESINATLMTVQRMVDEVKTKAAGESERLIADARSESERIIAEAKKYFQENHDEIQRLKSVTEAETQTMIRDAQKNAEGIVAEAYQKAAARYDEIDALKAKASEQARTVLDDARQEADRMMQEMQKKTAEVYEKLGFLREKTQADAQKLLDEARAEAARIREEIQKERTQVQEELNLLTQRKYKFQASMKALLETHLKLLEGGDNGQP